MFGRNFLTIPDLSAKELRLVLDVSKKLKALQKKGEEHKLLQGKTLAMVFQKPSNRTRFSFEVGMIQLGGYALNVRAEEVQLGKREAIADVARTMSRYVDIIMMRVLRHTELEEFAEASTVPVINGLSDQRHPCQAVGDLLTIEEYKGRLKGLTLCYVGDGNNVCASLIEAGKLMEMKVVVSCPKGYEPPLDPKSASYEIVSDPHAAVAAADVVYTDVWTSMGQEEETMARLRAFSSYTVSEAMMAKAAPDAIFMHCLPAHRGEEVEDPVIDGPQSVVFDQAENRMHAQKGILALLMKKDLGI